MTITEVLKVESNKSTITTGYVSPYALQRDGKVVAYVQACLENWRLKWTVSWYAGGKVCDKSSADLTKLLATFGDVDLVASEVLTRDSFFRLHPPD